MMVILELLNRRLIELRKAERACEEQSMRLVEDEAQQEAFGVACGRAQQIRDEIKWLTKLIVSFKRESIFAS